MTFTIKDIIKFAEDHNLSLDTEIRINGGELNYIFESRGVIFLDETETEEQ